MTVPTAHATEAVERLRSRFGWLESPVVDRVFKAIALVSLLGMLFVGGKQYVITSCNREYIEASNANQQLRAGAAAEERTALDELISSIDEARSLKPADSKVALDLAFRRYAEARARIEGKREVMPIPPPPSQTCG